MPRLDITTRRKLRIHSLQSTITASPTMKTSKPNAGQTVIGSRTKRWTIVLRRWRSPTIPRFSTTSWCASGNDSPKRNHRRRRPARAHFLNVVFHFHLSLVCGDSTDALSFYHRSHAYPSPSILGQHISLSFFP